MSTRPIYFRDMELLFIGCAGLIHYYIFAMESLFWGRPWVNKVFGLSSVSAKENRLFAFNQGFYNFFLATAILIGMYCRFSGYETVGNTLMVYSSASMVCAALVLFCAERRLIRPALIQGLPPLIGLSILYIKIAY